MKTCKIYVLIDPTTNEIRYVGKTINEKERYKNHLNPKHNEKTHKRNWINKLKNNNLKPIFKVIEEVLNNCDWKDRERYWIEHYRQLGFNLVNHSNGGEGLDFKGNQTSFKENHVSWNKDKGNTEICTICNKEFKVSISQVNQGRKTCSHECSSILKQEYTKETQFKKGQEAWNKGNTKKLKGDKHVFQYSALTGEFIKEWNTAKQASLELNCSESGIGQCCRKIAKSAGGYIWEYNKLDKVIPIVYKSKTNNKIISKLK